MTGLAPAYANINLISNRNTTSSQPLALLLAIFAQYKTLTGATMLHYGTYREHSSILHQTLSSLSTIGHYRCQFGRGSIRLYVCL